jgi:hypothetical protein
LFPSPEGLSAEDKVVQEMTWDVKRAKLQDQISVIHACNMNTSSTPGRQLGPYYEFP